MDKFMIDPKEELINNLEQSKSVLNIPFKVSISDLQIQKEPINHFSVSSWLILIVIFFLILLIFTIFIFSKKYEANDENNFKSTLDELKENIKGFLRSFSNSNTVINSERDNNFMYSIKNWIQNWIQRFQSWNDKSKQFIFRQYLQDNTFKSKKTY